MTDILQRRRGAKTVSRLPDRLDALTKVLQLSEGRIDPTLRAEAATVADRARTRLTLSSEHTVVAFAGSTGSGKSSLFNAITGLDLAQVGVRRPTTSTALACVWGSAGAAGVLDWLGIDVRHQVMRSSVLENADDSELRGLVLLDLPDHDSTEAAHRLEVSRLVERVDVLIWVVDPQKYADAAIHEAFLRPLAGYADVVVVVLNHIDRLSRAEVHVCAGDLRRLLADDGLGDVPLLLTSAATGKGVKRLRALLGERVLRRRSYAARLSADLDRVSNELVAACGDGAVAKPDAAEQRRLVESLSAAAGIGTVSAAVERSYLLRGGSLVAWPPVRLARSFRRDPLRRLGIDTSGPSSAGGAVQARAALPAAAPVQRAQVDAAVRRFGDAAAAGAPELWARGIRAASHRDADALPEALDRAVVGTDLGLNRTPVWWRAATALQWILFGAAVVGLGWLALLALNGFAGLPDLPTPSVRGWPVPTLILLVGLILGIAIGAVGRPFIASAARRTGSSARRRLAKSIERVAHQHVVRPVEDELTRFGDTRRLLAEVTRTR